MKTLFSEDFSIGPADRSSYPVVWPNRLVDTGHRFWSIGSRWILGRSIAWRTELSVYRIPNDTFRQSPPSPPHRNRATRYFSLSPTLRNLIPRSALFTRNSLFPLPPPFVLGFRPFVLGTRWTSTLSLPLPISFAFSTPRNFFPSPFSWPQWISPVLEI